MSRGRFKPDTDDFVIVVMGPTGSGKSNFINNITGRREDPKASNLKPDTKNVTPYPIPFDGYRLVFIDTPGFDNTHRTDNEISRAIADWITEKYPDSTTLRVAGIIYLHRITDNHVSGSARKNLQMFDRLCGDIPLRRTRLVTTMWDLEKDQVAATQRETQLKDHFWGGLIDGGAKVHRFRNSPNSAWDVIDTLLSMGKDELQEELVRQQGFNEAGNVLYSRLQTLLEERRNVLRELAEEARLQNNPVLAKTLQREYDKIDFQLRNTSEEMKVPLTRRIILWLFGWKARIKAVGLDFLRD